MSDRVEELHRRGQAAIGSGRPVDGARLLRAALRLLEKPSDGGEPHPLLARVLISLASAEVQLGRRETGFALLDHAAEVAAPEEAGVLLQQRGLLLMLVGRLEEALKFMNEAEPLIDPADRVRVARGHLNRAMLHELAGRIRAAVADLDRCEPIAVSEDLPLMLAKARLNRGYLKTLTGDIPAALRDFDAARPGFAQHAPGLLPVLAVDKARALLGAGLIAEAATELDAALSSLVVSRTTHERAEAELTRAQVAIADGNPSLARQWARQAERRFRRRGNETWAAVASFTVLLADFESGRRAPGIAGRSAAVADRLAALGLRTDAALAALLAARAHVAAGRFDDARAQLRGRAVRPTLDLTLSRCLTLTELHAAEGNRAGVFTHARAGLAALHRHRGRFGSLDLQTGTAALGVQLARSGLTAALRSGRPASVFSWLERSRAQAFRLRPVRPPVDETIADAVAELRQRAALARSAELAGRRDPGAERRCVELERAIRAHGWTAGGTGDHGTTASPREVSDELAKSHSALVSFLIDEGRLAALTIAGHQYRLTDVADLSTVAEAIARLRGDLDTLCCRNLPARLVEAIRQSLRHDVGTLSDALIRPLRAIIGDQDLVVVPTGPLSAVPWGLLPELRGRPVTVTPSATAWLRGRRRSEVPRPGRRPLLVAGPNLAHAAREVAEIARTVPGSTALSGPAATVAATLEGLTGRAVVHFAAHGHHEHANVLFSRLDLADGPLMAYDIQQLQAPPEHVVLSACDVGRSVVRAGDEQLGFTAALLYGGTRSVVAGVARVPDEVVVPIMVDYHRIRATGRAPAQALAEATLGRQFVPLVCFGAG
ncbi:MULTISPECIES: CHAT domain-containing protein [unclassified Amycolatopsis]|uniref:CHAT domain-containing protein n=1 Tax=unclassified Amycolatopsis TaxID=2618356 RepID=UPI00287687D7|nr:MULTISPECIES: CHAT domain-containing protein [unclassified Amycolatopsis]MDS0134288.1 CHAT domain-containing protein [Amycolatopsis sp. 505]MDS0149613.1 CHAT domain-containing protein [Amycolatopsis sp. CM201R]